MLTSVKRVDFPVLKIIKFPPFFDPLFTGLTDFLLFSNFVRLLLFINLSGLLDTSVFIKCTCPVFILNFGSFMKFFSLFSTEDSNILLLNDLFLFDDFNTDLDLIELPNTCSILST